MKKTVIYAVLLLGLIGLALGSSCDQYGYDVANPYHNTEYLDSSTASYYCQGNSVYKWYPVEQKGLTVKDCSTMTVDSKYGQSTCIMTPKCGDTSRIITFCGVSIIPTDLTNCQYPIGGKQFCEGNILYKGYCDEKVVMKSDCPGCHIELDGLGHCSPVYVTCLVKDTTSGDYTCKVEQTRCTTGDLQQTNTGCWEQANRLNMADGPLGWCEDKNLFNSLTGKKSCSLQTCINTPTFPTQADCEGTSATVAVPDDPITAFVKEGGNKLFIIAIIAVILAAIIFALKIWIF